MFENNELCRFLATEQIIEINKLEKAYLLSQQKNSSIVTCLVALDLINSAHILEICKIYFNLPTVDLTNYQSDCIIKLNISYELINTWHLLPLKKIDQLLQVAIADPTAHFNLSALSFHTGLQLQLFLVDEVILTNTINKLCSTQLVTLQLENIKKLTIQEWVDLKPQTLIDMNIQDETEPIITWVDQLLIDAIQKKASDIHIEPYNQEYRIRFRILGLLSEAAVLPCSIAERVITRLKILAQLNIAERRLPQDGRFSFTKSVVKIDIRINCCPCLLGEKLVLRLLSHECNLTLMHLGLEKNQEKLLIQKLNEPQGLILVTGPTGSGKTTLLYAALNYLNKIVKNISSVEDPVEIQLAGINQIQIFPQIGWGFSEALRTLLRQDPDILMIGEIRDAETAKIALHAAQTGHLVLATLHANHALEAVARLEALGASFYSIVNTVTLLIAQRLIRQLCEQCKILAKNSAHIYVARGCHDCHDGYKGRVGIFECIPMHAELAQYLHGVISQQELNQYLKKLGILRLAESGKNKMLQGMTTKNELKRVLGVGYG